MEQQSDGFLCDTNVCINYMSASAKKPKKRTTEQQKVFDKINSLKDTTPLYTSQTAWAELLIGIEKSQNKPKNRERLEPLKQIAPIKPVDEQTWEIFAKITAELPPGHLR